MRYLIRKIDLGKIIEVEISESQYNAIFEARNNSLQLQFIEEKFDQLVENYIEFEDTLSQITSRFTIMGSPTTRHAFNSDRSLINRRIANLLTSARGFIDQSKHHFAI